MGKDKTRWRYKTKEEFLAGGANITPLPNRDFVHIESPFALPLHRSIILPHRDFGRELDPNEASGLVTFKNAWAFVRRQGLQQFLDNIQVKIEIHCDHEYVNMGFMHQKWVCKKCNHEKT